MKTNDNEMMTAPAGNPAGGKLKLSEVIAAMENHTLELDCKAVLLVVTMEYAWSLFNRELANVSDIEDLQLLQLHRGLSAIAFQGINFEPEAMAALAAAIGRYYREDEDGADGKEVEA